jgi:hypothetical protein
MQRHKSGAEKGIKLILKNAEKGIKLILGATRTRRKMTDCSISLGSASASEENAQGDDIAMEFANECLFLSFPCRLFGMLEDADEKGFRHIVSWNAEGNGFMVHDTAAFLKTTIPQYFNQTKYKSFQRQLSLYGFTRIATGRRKGLSFHPNFVRGSKQLCKPMRPITKPKESKSSYASSNTARSSISSRSASNSRVASSTTTTSVSPRPTEKAPEEPENVVPQTRICKHPSLVSLDSQCSLVDQKPAANGMVVRLGSEKRSMISPELRSSIAPKLDPCLLDLQEKDIGCFEGKTFFLMSLSSHLEKRNLPELPSSTTFEDPVDGDDAMKAQLRQAWKQGFATALAIQTQPSKPLPLKDNALFELDFWDHSYASVA